MKTEHKIAIGTVTEIEEKLNELASQRVYCNGEYVNDEEKQLCRYNPIPANG